MLDRPTNPTITAYLSSLGLSAFGLGLNELVALGGLLLAFATFIVNWRYKHLHYRLVLNTAAKEEGTDVSED